MVNTENGLKTLICQGSLGIVQPSIVDQHVDVWVARQDTHCCFAHLIETGEISLKHIHLIPIGVLQFRLHQGSLLRITTYQHQTGSSLSKPPSSLIAHTRGGAGKDT
jgi:hypothetical protein